MIEPPLPTAPSCTWCDRLATHLTIAPLNDIWHDAGSSDKRQTWAESCARHRRAIHKPRPREPWRPVNPRDERPHPAPRAPRYVGPPLERDEPSGEVHFV